MTLALVTATDRQVARRVWAWKVKRAARRLWRRAWAAMAWSPW